MVNILGFVGREEKWRYQVGTSTKREKNFHKIFADEIQIIITTTEYFWVFLLTRVYQGEHNSFSGGGGWLTFQLTGIRGSSSLKSIVGVHLFMWIHGILYILSYFLSRSLDTAKYIHSQAHDFNGTYSSPGRYSWNSVRFFSLVFASYVSPHCRGEVGAPWLVWYFLELKS